MCYSIYASEMQYNVAVGMPYDTRNVVQCGSTYACEMRCDVEVGVIHEMWCNVVVNLCM
jgi:hypothetical protein